MELIDKYELTNNSNEGYVLLCDAIEKGNTTIAKHLLSKVLKIDNGINNINCCNSALHFAAMNGDIEIVNILLSKGACVDSKNAYGRTPLHCVIKGNEFVHPSEEGSKVQLVKIFLKNGANVDSQCDKGFTPLHLAAEEGHQKIVETLLKFGADTGCIAYTGYKDEKTALNLACEGRYLEIVKTLLNYGADVTFTDINYTVLIQSELLFNEDISLQEIDDCDEIIREMKLHMLKMKILNLYNMSQEDSNEIKDEDYILCEEEIIKSKIEKIINSNVSFYDILAKGTNTLATYMENENVVQELQSGNYKTKFPIYANIIENNFRKGMNRKDV